MLPTKTLSMCVAALALAACATLPPGEDQTGQNMKRQSEPVLPALSHYHQDHNRYPASLYELAPQYLKEVPFEPNLQFDAEQGTLSLHYKKDWPSVESVICTTPLQAPAWVCRSAP